MDGMAHSLHRRENDMWKQGDANTFKYYKVRMAMAMAMVRHLTMEIFYIFKITWAPKFHLTGPPPPPPVVQFRASVGG